MMHSFGYDCLRRANICLLDKLTIAYVAGNLVEIVNINTLEQTYIRSTGGGAVGAICVSHQFTMLHCGKSCWFLQMIGWYFL